MLNLNYNIIGANQPFVYRGALAYEPREDLFSGSIVVAIPGALFVDGLYTNQFGMTNPYDDISAYIRGGAGNAPIGTNLEVILSSSIEPSSSSFFMTQSNAFDATTARYNQAVALNGANSLVVNKTWAAGEGANFTSQSSFVIESYVSWYDDLSVTPETTPTSWFPQRAFAWKYDPGDPVGSQYYWEGNWGGDSDTTPGTNWVSGSGRFSYTSASFDEDRLTPTSSFDINAGEYRHYAIVYTAGREQFDGPGFVSQSLKLYIDGQLRGRTQIPDGYEFNYDEFELLQVMGAVDSTYVDGGYSGSLVSFNDYRVYNGTDKDYTGSVIIPPQSMIVWGGY